MDQDGIRLHVNRIDQEVGEIDAMLRTLAFLAVAEHDDRQAQLPSIIAMLHVMMDKAGVASRAIGEINRLAAGNIARTPCEKITSHGLAYLARFLFRSPRPKR